MILKVSKILKNSTKTKSKLPLNSHWNLTVKYKIIQKKFAKIKPFQNYKQFCQVSWKLIMKRSFKLSNFQSTESAPFWFRWDINVGINKVLFHIQCTIILTKFHRKKAITVSFLWIMCAFQYSRSNMYVIVNTIYNLLPAASLFLQLVNTCKYLR